MALVRVSSDNSKRVFAFRAWHRKLRKMCEVKTCGFDTVDRDIELVLPKTEVAFQAAMRDVVLQQDTNSTTESGEPIYEGDLVLADIENTFGSMERVVGEVAFDIRQWGYNIKGEVPSGLPPSGKMDILCVVGNIFEGIDESKIQLYGEQEHNERGENESRGVEPDGVF